MLRHSAGATMTEAGVGLDKARIFGEPQLRAS